MNRKILVEEIVDFYFNTGLLDEVTMNRDGVIATVESCLEKAEHIETIINTIIIRAKTQKNLDVEKLKRILIGLEMVRLELEYKDYSSME